MSSQKAWCEVGVPRGALSSSESKSSGQLCFKLRGKSLGKNHIRSGVHRHLDIQCRFVNQKGTGRWYSRIKPETPENETRQHILPLKELWLFLLNESFFFFSVVGIYSRASQATTRYPPENSTYCSPQCYMLGNRHMNSLSHVTSCRLFRKYLVCRSGSRRKAVTVSLKIVVTHNESTEQRVTLWLKTCCVVGLGIRFTGSGRK